MTKESSTIFHSSRHLAKFLAVPPPPDISILPAEWNPSYVDNILTVSPPKGFNRDFHKTIEKLGPWGRYNGMVRIRTSYDDLEASYLQESDLPPPPKSEPDFDEQPIAQEPPRKKRRKNAKTSKKPTKASVVVDTTPLVGIHNQSVFPVTKGAPATKKNLPAPADKNVHRNTCYFKVLSEAQNNLSAQAWLDLHGSHELKRHINGAEAEASTPYDGKKDRNTADSKKQANDTMYRWTEKEYLERAEESIHGNPVIYSNDNEAVPILRDFFKLPVLRLEEFSNNILMETENLIAGIQTPYFYLGTQGATFAIHLEDYAAFSLSFLHVGAPKHWVFVAPEDAVKLEEFCNIFCNVSLKCSQSVRHGMVYFPTAVLRDAGIRFIEVEQLPGDLIVTWPWAYHQGWNEGCNIAEACGYATGKEWPGMMAPLIGVSESEATKHAKFAGGGAPTKSGGRGKANTAKSKAKKGVKSKAANKEVEAPCESQSNEADATPILYHKCWAGTRNGRKIGCGQQPAAPIFLGFGEKFTNSCKAPP